MLNLTQHNGSSEQVEQGLYEPKNKAAIIAALNFNAADILGGQIKERARTLARSAHDEVRAAAQDSTSSQAAARANNKVLIGGLPALMGPLVEALQARGLEPHFSHSDRVSEEQTQPDGSVRKVAVFRHQFFYPAP